SVTATQTAATPAPRLAIVDLLRGAAILAMIVYHAAWDLTYFRLIPVDVGLDPGWRWFAHIIAGTFLGLVGISLVLATRNGFRLRPYLRRLGILVAAAAAVTLVTWRIFPDEFVYFGILHVIALSSIVALPFLGLPPLIIALAAAACFAAPVYLTS